MQSILTRSVSEGEHFTSRRQGGLIPHFGESVVQVLVAGRFDNARIIVKFESSTGHKGLDYRLRRLKLARPVDADLSIIVT
jgi:hypothetical protein